jgi:hypothetical protein
MRYIKIVLSAYLILYANLVIADLADTVEKIKPAVVGIGVQW